MRNLLFVILFLVFSCNTQHISNTKSLELYNQNLKAIPDSVFSLTNLEYLNIGNSFTIYPPLTALSDEVPTDANLNRVEQIPEDIEKLRKLRVLILTANNLRKLPKGLSKLKQLDTLDIALNTKLTISNELDILTTMSWLKYLDIMATGCDQKTFEKLQKSLPNTRIVWRLKDILEESSE